jgi:hypothetical protein
MNPNIRIFCIPALRAPIVAVIRRGPSAWMHVGRWDIENRTFESGSWLHGTIYNQRCDLSPDGQWFCYFAMSWRNQWRAGTTYIAISRLPALSAIAAWGTCGTWTRGLHFVERPGSFLETPHEGDAGDILRRFGLSVTRPSAYNVEQRRGWRHRDTVEQPNIDDFWEERRAQTLVMEKQCPVDPRIVLCVTGYYAAFREGEPHKHSLPSYWIEHSGDLTPIPDAQWADWTPHGDLLVASTMGCLQIRAPDYSHAQVLWEYDAGALRPPS